MTIVIDWPLRWELHPLHIWIAENENTALQNTFVHYHYQRIICRAFAVSISIPHIHTIASYHIFSFQWILFQLFRLRAQFDLNECTGIPVRSIICRIRNESHCLFSMSKRIFHLVRIRKWNIEICFRLNFSLFQPFCCRERRLFSLQISSCATVTVIEARKCEHM